VSRLERPVCGKCAREMTCSLNGQVVVSQNARLSWRTDLYSCTGCGCEVAVGSSESSIRTEDELWGGETIRLEENS